MYFRVNLKMKKANIMLNLTSQLHFPPPPSALGREGLGGGEGGGLVRKKGMTFFREVSVFS